MNELAQVTICYNTFYLFIILFSRKHFSPLVWTSLSLWKYKMAIKWSNQGTLMWCNVTGDVLSANCHWKHKSQNFSSFHLSRLHLARLSSVRVSHSVLSDALGPQIITPLIPEVEDLRTLLSITHFASLNTALYFLWQTIFFYLHTTVCQNIFIIWTVQ